MPFAVRIIAPDRTVFETEEATFLLLPGLEGELGVEADHAPMLVALACGRARVRYGAQGQRVQELSISRGFARIGPGGVLVLADAAERVEEIDVERARAARARAEQRLRTGGEHVDMARAEAALERALGRLRVAGATAKA